uniref:LRRCT domain-containing protein n=1 Tax=Latimeria chalumnae TaxID=7897 RepID=H3ASB9_LATCH
LMASCPASCVVCFEETTICQGLTYILAVPETTKVLILTDGVITNLDKTNLSFLFNVTLLGLSNNGILDIKGEAFHGLTNLKTLLLDQNNISSSVITDTTFIKLYNLEVLALQSNALIWINGTWFKDMKKLISLLLEGNEITRLEGNTFKTANLQNLKTLDLSKNFINYIDKEAFVGLPHLQELDLSRNSLSVTPDAFSYLTQLTILNLNLNHWNCTCDLRELSSFLRNYSNSPYKVLKNVNNLKSVQSVLQLTDRNCTSSPQNTATVQGNTNYMHYVRDVVLTAVFCFIGAVCLTVTVVALLYWKFQQSEEDGDTTETCSQGTGDKITSKHHLKSNCITKGKSNCKFTEENEVKVMSIVGHVNEVPLLQQNRNQKAFPKVYKTKGRSKSLRSIQKENENDLKPKYFMCLNCQLPHSIP